MAGMTLDRWLGEFSKNARKDKLATLRQQMLKFGLEGKPKSILDGTLLMVIANSVYLNMDGHSESSFLQMQTYDPRDSSDGFYILTFDICGKACARLLAGRDFAGLHLGDLYDHPWDNYKTCGYIRFWIQRIDSAPIKARELRRIELRVSEDLHTDYTEGELDVTIDDSEAPYGLLHVDLQQNLESED